MNTHRISIVYVFYEALGTLFVVQFLFLTSWQLITLVVYGNA